MSDAYDRIDRFLRNNLDDADYAEYSIALDSLLAAPAVVVSAEPVAWKSLTDREWVNVVNSDEVKEEGSDVHMAVCAAFKLIEAKLREKNERHLATPVGPDAVDATHRLVPVEPTPAMRKAAADAWLDSKGALTLSRAGAALKAGIAAAPEGGK